MKAVFEKRKYSPDFPIQLSIGMNFNFPPHWHSDIEILFILEGEMYFYINGVKQLLTEGDMAVCGSADIHFYSNEGNKAVKFYSVIFRTDLIDKLAGWPETGHIAKSFILKDDMLTRGIFKKVTYLFDSIFDEYNQKLIGYKDIIKSRLLELTTIIIRNYPPIISHKDAQEHKNQTLKLMRDIITYIEVNYQEPISLKTIAQYFNLSHFHFSRIFKSMFNKNFKEYLDEYRIFQVEIML